MSAIQNLSDLHKDKIQNNENVFLGKTDRKNEEVQNKRGKKNI